MRLNLFAVSFALIATAAACDSAARRQRDTREQFQRQQVGFKRQEDSAIAATRASLRRELPKREAQWAAHRITDYRLAVRIGCFCEPPPLAVVTVRGNSVTVQNALDQPLSERHTEWLAFSVPKLFDEVRRMVADTACRIDAYFDSTYGFPNFVRTDNRRMSDIGYTARVEAFEILPARSASRRLRQN